MWFASIITRLTRPQGNPKRASWMALQLREGSPLVIHAFSVKGKETTMSRNFRDNPVKSALIIVCMAAVMLAVMLAALLGAPRAAWSGAP
jgi:hypothetical protein